MVQVGKRSGVVTVVSWVTAVALGLSLAWEFHKLQGEAKK